MNLNQVVVVDSVPIAPSFVPMEKTMQCLDLCNIFLPSVKDNVATLLIGNNCIVVHHCSES